MNITNFLTQSSLEVASYLPSLVPSRGYLGLRVGISVVWHSNLAAMAGGGV